MKKYSTSMRVGSVAGCADTRSGDLCRRPNRYAKGICRNIAAMALAYILLLSLPETARAQAGTYHTGDIAVINAMITTNSLGWTPAAVDGSAAPVDWMGVQWSTGATPYRITSLNVSGMGLTGALDVSDLTALEDLECAANQLTALDVSGLTALQEFICSYNQLTTLDVSDLTALQEFTCSDNQLTTLDVSDLTALKRLGCYCNQLTTLNVSGLTALKALGCYYNQLTTLDVSDLTALQGFACSENLLTALDVSDLTALQEFDCSFNQLTALDVSALTALQEFDCDNNQLTMLDVSALTDLEYLDCSYNQLTALNTLPSSLQTLLCYNNRLTSLDVSGTMLNYIDCRQNYMTTAASDVTGFSGTWDDVNYFFNIQNLPTFKAVTNIINLPSAGVVGVPLALTGTVVPADATKQDISWRVEIDGLYNIFTYATIDYSTTTVTATAPGTVLMAAVIEDGMGTADFVKVFPITFAYPTAPTVITTSLAGGTTGVAYSQTLVASGIPKPTWSIDAGTLPAGLSLDPATGVISGTPTAAGTFNFTVKATNDSGSDTQALSITVSAVSGTAGGLLFNVADGLFYQDNDGNQSLNAGDTPYTGNAGKWSWNGTALTLNGFNYTVASTTALTIVGGNIHIVVEGKNAIINTYAGTSGGIASNFDMTLSGNGSLDVEGAYGGLWITGDLTVNGGSINANGKSNRSIFADNVTVTGGTVTAEGAIGIAANTHVIITGGTVIAKGIGTTVSVGIFAGSNITIAGDAATVTASGDYDQSTSNGGAFQSITGTVSVTGSRYQYSVSGNVTGADAVTKRYPYDGAFVNNNATDLWVSVLPYNPDFPTPIIRRQVTLPKVKGASSSPSWGVHYVNSRDNFTFTLTPHEGYTLDGLTVKTGTWRDTEPGGVVLVSNNDGSVTVTIRFVNNNIDLTITGAGPTANATLAPTGVWSHGGRVYITASQSGEAYIYNISGQLVTTVRCTAGQTQSVPLPVGLYVVHADGKTYKIINFN